MAEAVHDRIRVNLEDASAIAASALDAALALGDTAALGWSFRAKAHVLYAAGRNREAVDFYDRAVSSFEQVSDSLEIARTLSSSILALNLLGEYERAVSAANRARKIFTEQSATQRLARLDINLANVFHRQDRFAEALACYERAYQELLPRKDAEGIAVALHNMAVCLISLNDFQRALETHEKAREVCRQAGMDLLVRQADYNIAWLHYLHGDYGRALELLHETRAACRTSGDAYHSALCDLDQSEIYLELNLPSEAAEMAEHGLRQFQELGMGYEAAKCMTNLALSANRRGDFARATELLTTAREAFRREQNQVWPSLIDLYQALVLYKKGQFPAARQLCATALEFFHSSPLADKAIVCHVLHARLCLAMGNVQEAEAECRAALRRLEEIENPVLSYQVRLVQAQICETQRQTAEAFAYYRAAREMLERLRNSLPVEELKIAFMKSRMEVYEALVRLCLAKPAGDGGNSEIFEYIEQAKSRILIELITGHVSPTVLPCEEESESLNRIRNLREELNWYYRRIGVEECRREEILPGRIDRLMADVRERERELQALCRELPPRQAERAGLPTPPITLEEVQEALPPDTTLVEYFRVEGRLLAAVIDRQRMNVVPLAAVADVQRLLRMLEFQLSKFRLGAEYVQLFSECLRSATLAHLNELHRAVLAPLRPYIKARHLVIVPHEELHYLPFHALFNGEHYAIDTWTISYAASASMYVRQVAPNGCASGPALVLGLPDDRTPFINSEVEAVAGSLPGCSVFLGSEATAEVLRQKGASSRIVHIATHGQFRRDNPMFSSIYLADAYVAVYDLYSYRLPVEILTLSGCGTGLNQVAAGDELLGLARGLLYAGARSLLLSLWDVNDSATAELMGCFYARWRDGSDKPTALRSAMLEVRERQPHPYYWAPFFLVGNVLATST